MNNKEFLFFSFDKLYVLRSPNKDFCLKSFDIFCFLLISLDIYIFVLISFFSKFSLFSFSSKEILLLQLFEFVFFGLDFSNICLLFILRTFFSSIPLTICDLDETKQKISQMYSEIYNDEMLDLEDGAIEQSEYEGVKVLKLSGQSFNICVHRIFNFDFNMNSIANEILNNPEQWSLSEGSNTISTTLITDKKIAALFRPLKEEHESRFYTL